MRYEALRPLAVNGDYIAKGVEVELTDEEAKRFDPADISPVDTAPVAPAEPEPEKPVDEMNQNELKAKAKELGLSTTGSKADLLERIQLHLADNLTNDN